MDEVVEQVANSTGVDRTAVAKAIGIVINFLTNEGPRTQVQAMVDGLPGARELAERYGGSGRGLMGVYGDLSAAGLGMGEIQSVVRAFVAEAKARVGAREVDQVIGAIPGLSAFV